MRISSIGSLADSLKKKKRDLFLFDVCECFVCVYKFVTPVYLVPKQVLGPWN